MRDTASNHTSEVERLMLRLNLVVPEGLIQDYDRRYREYKAKLTAEAKNRVPSTAGLPLVVSGVQPPIRPAPLFLAYDTEQELLFDIVDGLLALIPYRPAPEPPSPDADPIARILSGARSAFRRSDPREPLQRLLDDARSVYTIREDGRGLERRVSLAATAAVAQAIATAGQSGRIAAADRLRAAWMNAHCLHPNPGVAYADAVRAVEAVANPIFLPADPAPTLGKVLAHLRQSPGKYHLVIASNSGSPADVNAIMGMMETLWTGHRDRHEGGPTSAPITQGAAEAAVSIAISLVQLLATNAVRRS